MENRKRRRRSALTPVILAVMLFFICVAVICLIILKARDNKKPIFKEISITEEVTAKAYVWLNQIEDIDISYEEVRGIMGDISITVELKPSENKGMKLQEITDGSYQKCYDAAYNGMAEAYNRVVSKRLLDSGYEGELSANIVDSLMKEAYGLSVMDYLKQCEDLTIIPSEDELKQRFNVEVEYE